VLQEIIEIEIIRSKVRRVYASYRLELVYEARKKSSLKHLSVILSLVSRKNSGIHRLK